jgi:hypothetical protein
MTINFDDLAGEQLAREKWACHGCRLILDKKVYAKTISTIKDAGVRRSFDRALAQFAADSRLILRPKLPQRRKQKKGVNDAIV